MDTFEVTRAAIGVGVGSTLTISQWNSVAGIILVMVSVTYFAYCICNKRLEIRQRRNDLEESEKKNG